MLISLRNWVVPSYYLLIITQLKNDIANFTHQQGDEKSPYKQSDCHPDILHPVITRNVGDEVNSPSKLVNITQFWSHSGIHLLEPDVVMFLLIFVVLGVWDDALAFTSSNGMAVCSWRCVVWMVGLVVASYG